MQERKLMEMVEAAGTIAIAGLDLYKTHKKTTETLDKF